MVKSPICLSHLVMRRFCRRLVAPIGRMTIVKCELSLYQREIPTNMASAETIALTDVDIKASKTKASIRSGSHCSSLSQKKTQLLKP